VKALVSAACVAVIAFVGYFFWGEWNQNQKDTELAAVRDSALVQACQRVAAELAAVQRGESLGRRFVQEDAKAALRTCVADGHIGLADLGAVSL